MRRAVVLVGLLCADAAAAPGRLPTPQEAVPPGDAITVVLAAVAATPQVFDDSAVIDHGSAGSAGTATGAAYSPSDAVVAKMAAEDAAAVGAVPPCASVVAPVVAPVVSRPVEREATPAVAVDDLRAAERAVAWFGRVGYRDGKTIIDGASIGEVSELVLAGGVRLGRLAVAGEVGGSLVKDDAATSPTAATDGTMARLGLYGRYAFAHGMTADRRGGGLSTAELYVQAGGGEEVIQWDHGGRLVRPELAITVGAETRHRDTVEHSHGYFFDVRFQVARRIDRDGDAATCAAPCTEATPPVAWTDRSVLIEGGLVFGK